MNPQTKALPFCSALFLPTFLHCILQPGWTAVAVFLIAMLFAGYVLWVDPFRKDAVSSKDVEDLKAKVEALKNEITATRMKIGLR